MQEINKIVENYCDLNEITKEELLNRSRKREFIEKRAILINILRKKRFTFELIGKVMNLDHSTVMYHTKDFDFIIQHDLELREKYESFKNNLK